MDEGGRVVLEERDRRHLLAAQDRRGKLLGQVMMVVECSPGGIDVDHRHCFLLSSVGGRVPRRDERRRLTSLLMVTAVPRSDISCCAYSVSPATTPSASRPAHPLPPWPDICAL